MSEKERIQANIEAERERLIKELEANIEAQRVKPEEDDEWPYDDDLWLQLVSQGAM
jgi:hypothetical protein